MKIFTYLKRHTVLASSLVILIVIIMVIAGRVAARKATNDGLATAGQRQVSLVPASAFRQDLSTVSANGTVESVSQADLKSQVSAPVAYINKSIGANVYVGEVILELKNDDIRARLNQAKAALILAEGGSQTGEVSLASARVKAVDESKNAYSTADQAIRGQIGSFLFNSSGGTQSLVSRISDFKLVDRIYSEHGDVVGQLDALKLEVDSLSGATADAKLSAVLAQSKLLLATALSLIDEVSAALNVAGKDAGSTDASTISGWKTVTATAKASLSAGASAVTLADTTLKNSLSAQDTTVSATISSAKAGVAGLEAELAKTIITSPINGKVAALPLRVGELASPGMLLATVVGGQGLQVKAYVSGEDMARVSKGAIALVEDRFSGVVSAVAPSVSSINKKVEVTIALSESDRLSLVVGQSVSVDIKSSEANPSAVQASSASYFLPIQNVKIVPGDAYVFTVDENSKAVRHSVVLGDVSGDFIEIVSGMTDDMELITPVYELEEGQGVDVR